MRPDEDERTNDVTSRTLILMRHSKSSWRTDAPDVDRPLAGRGRRDAVAAGHLLAGYPIDLALMSPAKRAVQTWERARSGGASASHVRREDDLYLTDADTVVSVLTDLPDRYETVLVVAHEPTLSELASLIAKPGEFAAFSDGFPTSAVAVLTFTGPWSALSAGQAELVRFEVPRGGNNGHPAP